MNLPADWEVPEDFRRRLGNDAGRQRIMEADGHLLIILHAVPDPEENLRQGRFFWRKPDGSWESTLGERDLQSLVRHLDEFQLAIDKCEAKEDHADEAREYFEVLKTITPLKRAARHMAQVLQDARKACPMDRDLINLRDRAVDLERAAELLAADSRNAMDFAIAREAERQSSSSNQMAVSAHKLNLFAAFFFPIATLCAIFATNLESGLDEYLAPPWGLFVILLSGIGLGVVLTWFVIAGTKRER